MVIDFEKLPPAPWKELLRDWQPPCVTCEGREVGIIITGNAFQGECVAQFIALARNAFDGDPEALAWWEANRKHHHAVAV